MKTLIVRHQGPQGHLKTWRLRSDEGPKSFGRSRLADLFSLDSQVSPFEGVFEYRDGRWAWLALETGRTPIELALEDGSVVQLGETELRFELHQKDEVLLSRLTNGEDAADGHELELVLHQGRLLKTRLRGVKDEPFGNDGTYDVQRRRVRLSDVRALKKTDLLQGFDAESRRGALILAGCSMFAFMAFVFGPRGSETQVALAPRMSEPKIIALAPVKAKKGSVLEKKQQQAAASTAAAPGPSAAPSGGKVAGLLKAVESGRLSKLLGKVSAQAARSAELVISRGVKAGEGSSGRALASVGSVDRSGKDWSGDATGTGVTVSTRGKGGGGILGGVGLAAGRTGSAGGVGLVEDESEIVGGLDRDVIAGVIKSQLGQILYCYERQLSADPDLFGKVAVRFTIGPNGAVESQAIGDTTLKNKPVEGCILTKVAAWKFPAPTGGTKVMVTYPFLFKSTN